MTRLYASNSSEYFAVREPGRLYVYRDSYLKVTHRVHDRMAGELICLADNGDAIFRSDEGVFRLRLEKGVRAERCHAVAGLDGSPEGGVLKGFSVKADGEQVAYEQVLPAQRFTSKLKRLLGQKSAQGDVGPSLHRFVLSRWSGRSSNCYYETVVDPRQSAGLVWWTSADFGFLSVLERDRDGRSLVRLIDVMDESVVSEFLAEGRLSRDRFLTTNGTIGFGMEKDGRRAFIVWTYSQERYAISYPKEARVLHLSKSFVAFLSKIGQTLIVKNFRNQVVTEVSLEPLSKLGIQFMVQFNPRESVELVTYQSGKLRVHHTDLEALPIDAKRWQLLGESQRAAALESQAEVVVTDQMAHLQASREMARRGELAAELAEFEAPPERAPSGYPSPSSRPIEPAVPTVLALETLEGSVPETQAHPPQLSSPGGVPYRRGEDPTQFSGHSSIQAAPTPGRSFQRPPGDSPPVSASRAPAPRRNAPRGPAPTTPPVSAPSPTGGQPGGESLAPGEALERLRMRYIAGELTREDYYNEKSLIERGLKGS